MSARSCGAVARRYAGTVLGVAMVLLAAPGIAVVLGVLLLVDAAVGDSAAHRAAAPAPAASGAAPSPRASTFPGARLARAALGVAVGVVLAAPQPGVAAEARALVVGVHTATWHDAPGFHAVTPGLYAIAPSGATGGVLRNSEGRGSAYAGWTWRTPAGPVGAALTLGLITGYRLGPVLPMAVPSLSARLGPHLTLRAIVLPRWHPKQGATAVNLALEWS